MLFLSAARLVRAEPQIPQANLAVQLGLVPQYQVHVAQDDRDAAVEGLVIIERGPVLFALGVLPAVARIQ